MYETKTLLQQRGTLKIQVVFTLKNGNVYVEFGYSQNQNVKMWFKYMLEEALLNAFYKLNHRLDEALFTKANYNENISDYIDDYHITEYTISYYEDRRYSYKQEGAYTVVYREDIQGNKERFEEEITKELPQPEINQQVKDKMRKQTT